MNLLVAVLLFTKLPIENNAKLGSLVLAGPYKPRTGHTGQCMIHATARRRIFGDFLGPAFPASRVQHISDLHIN